MLHAIQNKLGIECDDQTELADLEMPTSPEDGLRALEFDPETVKSISAWDWIINAASNEK